MTKPIKTLIFATALAALAACSDDVATGQFTVGDDDNLVRLSTGVQSAPSTALPSRALDGHYALQEGTAINLYVEGDWTGKTPSNIIKTPVYSAQKDTDADNINALKWKSGDHLYWDDFGTADPDNTANRTKGLGILAVAIDGVKSATSVPEAAWLSDNSSNDFQWTVTTDGTNSFKNDLLVANNLYHVSDATPIYRYTFDEQKELASKPEEARLDFKHVLSKITFKLTAGKGFTDIHGNPGFLDTPIVTLTRNKTGESNPEWCYTSGTVNIKTAKATNNGPLSLSKVVLDDIDRTGAIVIEEAIIYPESAFGNNDTDVIAQINSFGNVYYITAEKIRKAIYDLGASHEHASKYYTLPGYNYIFNITLNKTDVVVTATITDWKTVTATEDIPEILPMATISWGNGGGTAADLKEFKFYSSYAKNNSYSDLATAKCDAGADGSTTWTFYDASDVVKKLYWPSHDTHLFFRGISPSSTTVNDQKEIAISNTQYTKGTNPANLLIGMPEISSGTMCSNPDHEHIDMSVYGICARKEPINLNFRYMMSQVEVILNTTSGADKVAIGENTVVEITNAYSSGVVSLGTREVTVSGSKGNYTLDADAVETDADKKKLQRRSAIVPQSLEGLKFKVTVTNDNGTKDVYYSSIKDILVESNTITKWESGYHYKYTLTLKKTGISVTATITDWITASGSDNVWM